MSNNPPDSISIHKKKLKYSGRLHFVHWSIIALSVVLTLGVWYYTEYQHEKKIEERFNLYSSQVVELVKERIQLYEHALLGAAAFIDASENELHNEQWREYVARLEIERYYPGINGIGVIHNIKPNELNTYLIEQRQQRPDYDIHPVHQRDDLWPITYIEPAEINAKAIGLDIAFEQNRYQGVIQARDTGQSQLTGPIVLVQDEKQTPGFLFYTPFYKKGVILDSVESRRESIIGMTYSPVIMSDLISGTLAIDKRHVSIKISDNNDVLYDDSANKQHFKVDPKPLFSMHKEVDLYGRTWQFDIGSNLIFRQSASTNQSYFILLFGIIIDLLLFGLFIFLSRSNREALLYADQLTSDLQNEKKSLEQSNKKLEQFAYVASHDLKSPINAIKKIVTWLKEDCESLLPDESKEHLKLLDSRSTRMSNLLDDLLNFARIGHYDYKPELINLKSIVLDSFSLLDNSKNFTLSVDNVGFFAPRIPFETVLRNLISNSIKHHDKKHGSIKVTFKKGQHMQEIWVEDDGPGIPPELTQKALQLFQTLNPRDQVEGSGMGLSMVEKIMSHYKGEIKIESDGVRGTKMKLIFPLSE